MSIITFLVAWVNANDYSICMRTIERNIAVALIISADGKILQGQKNAKKGGVYSNGEWHIPGGGVNKGETLEEALIREVAEETALDIKGIPFELIDDTGRGEAVKKAEDGEPVLVKMKFNTFKIILPQHSKDIIVKPNDDLGVFRWTNISELKDIKLTPPSVELFKKLGYIK
jgi:8-oxo-dGTP pyrophosphatase MutT (NUDIX family)